MRRLINISAIGTVQVCAASLATLLMLSDLGCVAPSSAGTAGSTAADPAAAAATTMAAQSALLTSILSPDGTARNNAVCDPFGATPNTDIAHGLSASLYYLTPDQPQYTNVNSYLQHGHTSNTNLFFNQLNVPTRLFSAGFMAQDGSLLKDPSGNTLFEYFALHFESEIRLSSKNQPGNYQFAVLSDDGSILQINESGQAAGNFETLINNDGTHASLLGCATKAVTMTSDTRLPIKLDYYQGPRYHIALMLLWRFIPDTNNTCRNNGGQPAAKDLADVACGQSGNGTFFDYNKVPSAPQAPFIGMLARGWQVVPADNFYLPETQSNPCSGTCYVDRFDHSGIGKFKLSHDNVDQKSIHSVIDGDDNTSNFDSDDKVVNIKELDHGRGCGDDSDSHTHEVIINYCLNPTPTPSPSVTPSPSPQPSPSVTPSATPTPSPTPSLTPSPTPTPTPTATPTPSVTPSPTPTPTPTPSVTPSPSVTPTPSPSVTPSPTPTPSPSVTPSPSPTPTCTSFGCGGGALGV